VRPILGGEDGREAAARRHRVVARRYATALIQAGSQHPATGMFRHPVQTATLPGPDCMVAHQGKRYQERRLTGWCAAQ
jgi:hypothetical protein